MANLIYALPSDNLSPVATGGGSAWTLNTGTQDADYPAANLADLAPQKPAKLTTTTGSWVRDLGSAKKVDWVAIPMHNLTAALSGVKIEGNATNSWGAPSLSQSFTVPAYQEDGFPPGLFIDLTGIGSRTFQWWRFLVSVANGAPVAIGEIWLLGTKRNLVHNIHWGLDEADEHNVIEHRTPYGVVSMFDLATKTRLLEGETETSEAGLAAIKTWHRSCGGRAKPTLVVLDPSVNEVMQVRWVDTTLKWKRNFTNSNVVKLNFQEMSRGLVL